jgi:uncharacterized protein (TIGR01777 family)
MKIAVTGATGFIGSALQPLLGRAGDEIVVLRRPNDWNPEKGTVNLAAFRGIDAVVHLAGESIAGGRWTRARKARILESRVKGTKLIAETIAGIEAPPSVLISASAIGYYGNRGSELLREESGPGVGFLSDVCKQWEAATDAAGRQGIRVVHIRTGLVLSRNGGALPRMLLPFRLGIGGRVGSGNQYWSWISLGDVCAAIQHCLQSTALRGAVNLVSPSPVTNIEFTKILGRVLNRPTIFPLPASAARLALGEMSAPLLLASARVEPAKLQASRFAFRDPDLRTTLEQLLR